MKWLSPTDSAFLMGETADTMMHVGALLLFSPPTDRTTAELLQDLEEEIRTTAAVEAPWNQKLSTPWWLRNPLQNWVVDEAFDVDYHVRRSALPTPGGERELGVLVSRLHSNALDFRRPPWEMHFIEGLTDGRFAIYVKVHHALVDGYTGMQVLTRALATDPRNRENPMFFSIRPPERSPLAARTDSLGSRMTSAVKSVRAQATDAATLAARLVRLQLVRGTALVGSLDAPPSILNDRIGRNRRFATQQFSLSELKEFGATHGATLNDVVLAICGGALRRFLAELDELPEKPLIGFLPINLRREGDVGGGNAVGAMLASLGTHIEDPLERLEAIKASTSEAKANMLGMSQTALLAYAGALLAPAGLQVTRAMTGGATPLPINFNVCISNVPGPTMPLYLRGAHLEASYPVSIPLHSMALNITLHSYVDTLNFGFVGDRDAVPHLQRLAVYAHDVFDELRAAGAHGPAKPAQELLTPERH